jgi:hypothetical protein
MISYPYCGVEPVWAERVGVGEIIVIAGSGLGTGLAVEIGEGVSGGLGVLVAVEVTAGGRAGERVSVGVAAAPGWLGVVAKNAADAVRPIKISPINPRAKTVGSPVSFSMNIAANLA